MNRILKKLGIILGVMILLYFLIPIFLLIFVDDPETAAQNLGRWSVTWGLGLAIAYLFWPNKEISKKENQ